MKALNNLVSAGGFLIGIEALLIGQRFGLDRREYGGRAERLDRHEQPHAEEVQAVRAVAPLRRRLRLELMVKDLGIALEVGRDLRWKFRSRRLCQSIWSDAQSDLGTGHDHTEVAKHAAKTAGVPLN